LALPIDENIPAARTGSAAACTVAGSVQATPFDGDAGGGLAFAAKLIAGVVRV
jgi:hypothetical protein